MINQLSPSAYGLIGPNAAGKTTLLRKLHAKGGASIAPAAADATFAGLTVDDHVGCSRLARPGFNDALADRIIGDIPRRARFTALSAGQRRLLTLASALASDKPVLLLDEPLDGLDIASRENLRAILIELLEDSSRTLVLATHRAEDLVGLVEHVITVHDATVSEPMELESVRENFPLLTGATEIVNELVSGKQVLHKKTLGGSTAATLAEPLNCTETARAEAEGIEVSVADDHTLINLLASTERH